MIRPAVRLPAGAVLAAALLTLPPADVLRSGGERSLSAGESHVHEIALDGGAWLVTVEQLGIDIAVGVPGRSAVDAPFDRQGTETLVVTGPAQEVEVRALEAGAPPGRYSIRFEPLVDPGRLEAETAMSRAGEAYREGSADGRKKALAEYLRASELFRADQDRARALYAAAVLARLTGDNRQALELGERVLSLWQSLGGRLWEAATRNELGLGLWMLGRMDEARASFEAARSLQQAIGDRYGEGASLSNLCLMDLSAGELRAGLACYERALPLLREVQAGSLEGAALTNVGRVHDVLGEPDEALASYREALIRLRSLGDRNGTARTLNQMAVLYRETGDFQKALARYGEALEVFRELGDTRWQSRALHGLGTVYHALGEPRQALASYEPALRLGREAGDREGEAATLANLGMVQLRLGNPRAALELHRQALELYRAIGDRRGEGHALLDAGRAAGALGDPAAGMASLEKAVARLHEVGDLAGQAEALRELGEVLGDSEAALAKLERALGLARTARQPASEAQALFALARTERRLGRSAEARVHAEAALDVGESLRSGIGNPDLRASFSATQHGTCELLIDLLMEAHRAAPAAGHDRAALEVGERARARTLLELLGEADVDPGEGGDPALLERRTLLRRRLSAKAARALSEKEGPARAALEQEQQVILRELDLAEAEIRRGSPAYAALTRPEPLRVSEVQALLDADTVLLVYSLGEARSFLWKVTPGSVESHELPGRAAIEEAARRVHEGLSGFDVEDRARESGEAAELSKLLLGPVAARLEGKRLAVIADGALHYVPFGALPVSGPKDSDAAPVPLLERHEVVYLPSASALAAQRKRLSEPSPESGWITVLADPVFDAADPRVTGKEAPAVSSQARRDVVFERLPASRSEAEAIAALAPPGKAAVALDFEASRSRVLGERLSGYRVVHFATHGVLDAERPALSGLALSMVGPDGSAQEGFLHLRDVYGLRLDADLVVLSGCRTALGRELRGEGLVGLTRGFLYAGAPRVVASLWKVEDRATSELMTRFYRALWEEGLAPAAALRSAQLSLRRERRWRDPYFWAGFVLQGAWN
ncbi:MAG TPA: CHAT domain-containing tetratricopeptide repeat protein [Thermoanaerobaculia bacterium]|nr:CHAT domain-containing tetratricopeptide repeat protein [Thermoanaerobaculia bacterium]